MSVSVYRPIIPTCTKRMVASHLREAVYPAIGGSTDRALQIGTDACIQMEQLVFDALCKLYPQRKRRSELRTVAMISIGAMRLAMETWRQEEARKPLASYLKKEFESLALVKV